MPPAPMSAVAQPHPLRLPEELYLLCLKPDGSLENRDRVGYSLVGAALLELVLSERIVVENERVRLRSAEPTGHPGVDALLAQIAQHDGVSPRRWVQRFHTKLADPVGDLIMRAGLATRADVVKLDPLSRTHYVPVPGDFTPRLRQGVGAAFTGSSADQRTAMLVALADTAAILRQLEPSIDYAERLTRVDALLATTREPAQAGAVIDAVRREIHEVEAALR